MSDAIELLQLTKYYGRRRGVIDLEVGVREGEVFGFLGPNGAGKTTTFYMVVGLTAPDSGRVVLDGHDVTDDPMYVRARKGIGYLPQEPSIFRGLTVEQNIMAILETLDLPAAARRTRLRDLLAELGATLGDVLERFARAPALGLDLERCAWRQVDGVGILRRRRFGGSRHSGCPGVGSRVVGIDHLELGLQIRELAGGQQAALGLRDQSRP